MHFSLVLHALCIWFRRSRRRKKHQKFEPFSTFSINYHFQGNAIDLNVSSATLFDLKWTQSKIKGRMEMKTKRNEMKRRRNKNTKWSRNVYWVRESKCVRISFGVGLFVLFSSLFLVQLLEPSNGNSLDFLLAFAVLSHYRLHPKSRRWCQSPASLGSTTIYEWDLYRCEWN